MKNRIERSESAAAGVRRAVAELERCRPEQLGDLEAVVDLVELESIVDGTAGSQADEIQSIAFPYCGYLVVVRSDRTILIEP